MNYLEVYLFQTHLDRLAYFEILGIFNEGMIGLFDRLLFRLLCVLK